MVIPFNEDLLMTLLPLWESRRLSGGEGSGGEGVNFNVEDSTKPPPCLRHDPSASERVLFVAEIKFNGKP